MSSQTTIVVADDHPLFRGALRGAVGTILPAARIVEASGLEALTALLDRDDDVDLVLLDLTMPGVQGFSGLIYLRAQHPAIPVVIVSATEDPVVIRRALDFGAGGFIPKSASIEQIGEALRTVLEGGIWIPADVARDAAQDDNNERELAQRISSLTPQQFRVLMMLADGRLNKQIAGDLDVSEATIKAHMTAILRKLGIYRRTQAAVLAQQLLRTDAAAMHVETADSAEIDPDS